MKALQSPNYKTNVSKTEMIYHLEKDILDSHSLLFKYSVQLKDWEPHNLDLRCKVHLYFIYAYTSQTYPFLLFCFPITKNIRDYVFMEERREAV